MKNLSISALSVAAAFSCTTADAAKLVSINDSNVNQYITAHTRVMSDLDNHSQFLLKKSVPLPNGKIKRKYQQFYKDVPVYSSIISHTEKLGIKSNWWGQYLSQIDEDISNTKPNLSVSEAIEKAKNTVHIASKIETKNDKAILYIRQNTNTQRAELVYLVSFNVESLTPSRPYILLNAQTGKIIESWEGLTTRLAQGPGGNEKVGSYYYGRDYSNLVVSDSCKMKTDNVETYDMQGQQSGGQLYQFNCPENTYKKINGAYSPLNDAHYFGTLVFDMYKTWFKTTPLKDKLLLRVHFGQRYENAFWNGKQMTFGDGANRMHPLTSLDVVAHELSHGVTEQNSGLIYKRQSGGINEAFSDMAGEVAKFYMASQVDKENDWLVGGAIFKGPAGKAMRYFEDPTKDGRSIKHASDYNNALDVHFSSGVFNRAFYLLSHHDGWGVKKAFEPFLLANQIYWQNDTSFDSAACGVLKASEDLGYDTSDVISSFKEVGVNAQCQSPEPPPSPDSGEVAIKNGQLVTQIKLDAGVERRFVIKVPVFPYPPYLYKELSVVVFDSKRNAQDVAELYIRYDSDLISTSKAPKRRSFNDELFYLRYPAAVNYHILVKGKKPGVVNLYAIYKN